MPRKRRQLQEINAGSMADIAFLLLIFFLVATQIKGDQGILRILPPMIEITDPPPPINERNIFIVLVNSYDQLLVENEYGDIKKLREQVKEFVMNPGNDPDLSEKKEPKDIPLIGSYRVSKGIVSIQNDKSTSYGTYIDVQNEVAAAFRELRDDLSTRKFGKPFDKELLTKEQYEAIKEAIPNKVSEAEPKGAGIDN